MSKEFWFRSNSEEDLTPLTFNEPKRVGNPSTDKWGGLVLTVVDPIDPKLVIVSNEGRFVTDLDKTVELADFNPDFNGCSVCLKTN